MLCTMGMVDFAAGVLELTGRGLTAVREGILLVQKCAQSRADVSATRQTASIMTLKPGAIARVPP